MRRRWIVPLTAALTALGACAEDDGQADVEVAGAEADEPTTSPPSASEATIDSIASLVATTAEERSTAADRTTVTSPARPTTTTTTTTTATATPLAIWEGDTAVTDLDDRPLRLRAEVLSLTRADDVVTLEFSLQAVGATGTWSPNVDFAENSAATGLGTMNGVTLLDLVSGNRHLTLLDETGACLCSSGLAFFEGDQRAELYAQFPAPPAEVTTVSVVIPNIPPFEAVPITEGR